MLHGWIVCITLIARGILNVSLDLCVPDKRGGQYQSGKVHLIYTS